MEANRYRSTSRNVIATGMWTGVQRGSKPVSVHVPQRDRDRYVDGRSTSQRNRDRHRGRGVHVPQRDRDRYVDGRSTSRNVIATGTVDGHVDGGVHVPQRDRDRYVDGGTTWKQTGIGPRPAT